MMEKNAKIYVAGHRGMVGSAIVRELQRQGYTNIVEYSCAMKSHFRKFGNQMSGSGNHLCNYASLLA